MKVTIKKAKTIKPKYTISTFLFNTKKQAQAQLLKFEQANHLAPGTKVLEVSKVYGVSVEKVVKLTPERE